MRPVSPKQLRAAWIIAIAVDLIQMGLFFPTGSTSTWILDKPFDVLAMIVLWRLLGWHWVLMPSFVFELLPFAELAPTWTASVWFMTRRLKAQNIPELPHQSEIPHP